MTTTPPKMERATSSSSADLTSPKEGGKKKSYSGELYSMYYNGVNAITKTSTPLSDHVPCWVLAQSHTGSQTTRWANEAVGELSYFTYRNRLPAFMGPNKLDHDAGWGCMIRTGQMMLSEALRRVFMVKVRQAQIAGVSESSVDASRTRSFIRDHFRDTVDAPFGVFSMAREGANHAIPIGSWLTPTAVCRTIGALVPRSDVAKDLTVVQGLDGGVSYTEVEAAFQLHRTAVLLMVPIMAGMRQVGKSYQLPILRCLEMPNTVGIVGGKPQRSLYFVGHQKDDVFYLDPHVVQAAFISDTSFGNEMGPRGTCPVSSLDPCMVLCFLFHSLEEFDRWDADFQEVHRMSDFPMFSVVRQKGGARSGSYGAAGTMDSTRSLDSTVAEANWSVSNAASSPPASARAGAGTANTFADDCEFDTDFDVVLQDANAQLNSARAVESFTPTTAAVLAGYNKKKSPNNSNGQFREMSPANDASPSIEHLPIPANYDAKKFSDSL